jgi:hypothetical protein
VSLTAQGFTTMWLFKMWLAVEASESTTQPPRGGGGSGATRGSKYEGTFSSAWLSIRRRSPPVSPDKAGEEEAAELPPTLPPSSKQIPSLVL